MTFDPMTGKPIEDNEESSLQFDPMTGEPINQSAAPQQNAPGGFDPMTGEPINQSAAPQQNAPGGFDPMTGKPINQSAAAQQNAPGGFDPMTGKPIKAKKKKLPIFIGIAAAVAVFAVVVCAVISSGLFLGKSGKVMKAAANTFKDQPHIMKVLEPLSALAGDKFTVSASGEVNGNQISGEARVSGKEKQVSVLLDFESYPKVEMLAGIDSKSVKVQIPVVSKKVFVYNYKEKNTGYLVDEIDDIDTVNAMLESFAQGSNNDIYKELTKVVLKEFTSLELVNAEKEEFTINDKDVNCKGYTAIVTGNNFIHIIDGMEDIINNNYAFLYDNELLDTEDLVDEFDDLRDEFEDMEDIHATFYIYKNQLAAIRLEGEDLDGKMELSFEGGDYRMQNMTFKSGSYRVQLKGEDNGSKEKFTLKTRNGNGSRSQDIGSLEYNYENDKVTISVGAYSIEGKLTKSGSGLTMKIDRLGSYYGPYLEDVELTISKNVKMEKYSGKEFDLGNADEDELMELGEEIQDELYDSDLYYLLEDLF